MGNSYQITTILQLSTTDWNYVALSYSSIDNKFYVMVDSQSEEYSPSSTATRIYSNTPYLLIGDKKTGADLRISEFLIWKKYLTTVQMIPERLKFREHTLEFKDLVRYFKFQKIGDGLVLYDASNMREHCRMMVNNVWEVENQMVGIYDAAVTPKDWTQELQSSLIIKSNGINFPAPLRASPLDEGFTIEFWYQLKTVDASSLLIQLFKSDEPGSVPQIYLDSSNPQILNYQRTSTYSVNLRTSLMSLNIWYFMAISFNPASQYLHATVLVKGDSNQYTANIKATNDQSGLKFTKNYGFIMMRPINMLPIGSNFEAMMKELRIWDLSRQRDSIMFHSMVDVFQLYNPAIIGYWKMTYEIENYGTLLYDYSINKNSAIDVQSTTNYGGWDISTNAAFTLCPKNKALQISDWTCINDTDSLYKQNLVIHNAVNSSAIYVNSLLSDFSSWDWSADFYIKKSSDSDLSWILFNPTYTYRNFIDENKVYYGHFMQLQNNILTLVGYQYCYYYNVNFCIGSTSCINECIPTKNGTTGCRNLCQSSTGCTNKCQDVDQCNSFCNKNNATSSVSSSCTMTFQNSTQSNALCDEASGCDISFTSSPEFYVYCKQVTNYCKVSLINSDGASQTVSNQLALSSSSSIYCENSFGCEVTATNTRDLILNCNSATDCYANIQNGWTNNASIP
eukprot:403367263